MADGASRIPANLVWNAIFIALGMGLVRLAFVFRWVDDHDIMHPFPLFFALGSCVIFFATRAFVMALVAGWRHRRGD